MLRTHKTRPVGGALVLVLTLVASLCAGGLVTAAQADDSTTPAATTTASGDPTPQHASLLGSTGTEARQGLGAQLVTALGGPAVGPDATWVIKRGLTESTNVAVNDSCGGGPTPAPCTYSSATLPAGWGGGIDGNGVLTVWVPGRTVPGAYTITYNVSDPSGPPTPVQAQLTVAVTQDDYNPPAGMIFSHPYRKGFRTLIRNHVLRTINSVPSGASIQVASWSFASRDYRLALKSAMSRGVKVQIVLSQRNTRRNSDYKLLARIFGTSVTPDGSWVRRCSLSCRGTSGTMHSKIFLFSQAYRTPYVDISGSANLTDFAVTNQWNQMNTVTGDQAVYAEAVRIFNEMAADRPAPYVETHYPNLWTYYYPRGRATPANDFMLQALAPVRCTGAVNAGKGGRTIIKIAMYAWYQARGQWLAKRVRQLWNQGCQVQIVFAISSNPVKTILYSPSGRGRIPMRQILLTNKKHVPIYYLHDKWVSITGNYGGVPNNSVSFQGSFNFSDLGFASDEQFQMIRGRDAYNRFSRDFTLLWTDRQARAPSPISKIPTIEGRYSQNDLRLGTGVYRYMEAD
ncbi:phospholipase D-like domain-containing protein [Nocardioides pocheonensis]|uniref:phospholipase D n=1 Tax=Nocardioides pocheonensis TaxID=661485 RepID=A0A3N0GPJ0_9ACTN|nr:phospholipase D-like domain-containing protein [Nocardioides pocheonensis]RNM14321.1 hypothetical protein EFL26_15530 [Nocardioides pocheonensis]